MSGEVVIATFSGHVGETVQLVEGELWDATHPFVKAHPDWFTDDLLRYAVKNPDAVAEPPKRGPGRPKKVDSED